MPAGQGLDLEQKPNESAPASLIAAEPHHRLHKSLGKLSQGDDATALTLAGLERGKTRLVDGPQERLEHLTNELVLRSKLIIDRCDIDAGDLGDFLNRPAAFVKRCDCERAGLAERAMPAARASLFEGRPSSSLLERLDSRM